MKIIITILLLSNLNLIKASDNQSNFDKKIERYVATSNISQLEKFLKKNPTYAIQEDLIEFASEKQEKLENRKCRMCFPTILSAFNTITCLWASTKSSGLLHQYPSVDLANTTHIYATSALLSGPSTYQYGVKLLDDSAKASNSKSIVTLLQKHQEKNKKVE